MAKKKNRLLSRHQFPDPEGSTEMTMSGIGSSEGEECNPSHLDRDGYCDAVGCDNYGHTL